MVQADDKNKIAEQNDFYDARVLGITGEHFLSHVRLYHEFDPRHVVRYTFTVCYSVQFRHADEQIQKKKKSRWNPENYSFTQIDYFLQDVKIRKQPNENGGLYQCELDMGIAELSILCEDVKIERLKLAELTEEEKKNIVLPG